MSKFDWSAIDRHIDAHVDSYLAQLGRLVAQPSISAQNKGITECAALVATMLDEHGYSSRIMPTAGYPMVYGDATGDQDKTLLFYLHYDVQPPEPLELWDSPPFEMTLRDEKAFARGISDDKGHIIVRLAALNALKEVTGSLPCNVKFAVEGEEEIGSPSIDAWVRDNTDLLSADACVWEFGSIDHAGSPTIALGVRGIWYIELEVETANKDLHSGLGGSVFPNAAWRLIWALNSIKGADERILIPGFYDDVRPPTARDLELLEKLPNHGANWKEAYGIDAFIGEANEGMALKTQSLFQPTCTVNGLTSGYQGEGGKTIVPCKARAKLDFRLIPNQDPAKIAVALRKHLDDSGFSDVKMIQRGGYPPAKVDPDDPFVQLTSETAKEVFGRPAVLEPMIGGSGPMASFVNYLKLPIVTAGIGYPDSRVHAPNEHIRLDYFVKGIKHTARIIARFAEG